MKVVFLESGAEDCPILRLYDFTPEQLVALQAVTAGLHLENNNLQTIVSKMQLKYIGGCTLSFCISQDDKGVIKDSSGLGFTWSLSPLGWQKATDLIRAFRDDYRDGTYQWLDETSDISLLLSESGRW
jgi:hypothetical protein